jgi:mono/diheme cytochrome c family protein
LGVGLFLAVLFNFLSSAKGASPSVIDPVILEESAMQVMESHCFSCHGPKKQKGKLRLDTLETNDPVDLQELFAKM